MKRFALILILGVVLAGAAAAQTELRPLMPTYWISGTVADTPEASVGTRRIFFFRDTTELAKGNYTESNCYAPGNSFMLNAFTIFPGELVVGDTYQVATEQDSKGYGAGPLPVKITGFGWDEVTGLALYLGGGIIPPAGGEAKPRIKLWFGNRLYQPALVAKGEKFIVSSKPEVRADIAIDQPYFLEKEMANYTVLVDPGQPNSQSLIVSDASVLAKGYVVQPENKFNALSFKVPVKTALEEGEHVFVVTARSGGQVAAVSAGSVTATVEMMGGRLRLIGPPVTWPSPFSISKHKTVTIQYGLSADANIEIYIVGVGGVRAKKTSFQAGSEGGSAGINKVTWDGRTDQGTLAGNAIYVGSLISRDDGQLLGKFKVTILD